MDAYINIVFQTKMHSIEKIQNKKRHIVYDIFKKLVENADLSEKVYNFFIQNKLRWEIQK